MAKDIIHNAVKNALIKDGWTITADPFRIQYEEFDLSADLAAERSIAAEKGSHKIVVEIKSFVGRSFVRELQQAMGQYSMYLEFMKMLALEYELFVAISEPVYRRYFGQRAVKALLQQSQIPLLVVNIEREVSSSKGRGAPLRSSRGAGARPAPTLTYGKDTTRGN